MVCVFQSRNRLYFNDQFGNAAGNNPRLISTNGKILLALRAISQRKKERIIFYNLLIN